MPAVVLRAMPKALRFDRLVEVFAGGLGYGDVRRRACWLARSREVEKRSCTGLIEAGEPLMQKAVDAMREYH